MEQSSFEYEDGYIIHKVNPDTGFPVGIPYPKEDIILDFIGYDISIINGIRRSSTYDVTGIVVVPGDDVIVKTNTCIHFLEFKNKLTIPIRWDTDILGNAENLDMELIIGTLDEKPIVARNADVVVTGKDVIVKLNGEILDEPIRKRLISFGMYICTLKPGNFIFAKMRPVVVKGCGYCKPVCTSYEHISLKELTTGISPISLVEEQNIVKCDMWSSDMIHAAYNDLMTEGIINLPDNVDSIGSQLFRPLCTRVGFHYNWFKDTKTVILEACDAIISKLNVALGALDDYTITNLDNGIKHTYRINDADDTLGNLIVNHGVRSFEKIFGSLHDESVILELFRTTLISYEKKMHEKFLTIDLKLPDHSLFNGRNAHKEFLTMTIEGIIVVVSKIKDNINIINYEHEIPKMYAENPFQR